MKSNRPEALRLADMLEKMPLGECDNQAAAELRRLQAELDAQRVYARLLCKAVDAATDFAGTVAGGASWWEDVWSEHEAALDAARDGISRASGGEL